ncbi:MAG: hypothetical protein WKG00_11370 [Polyangiaceae bacterium]
MSGKLRRVSQAESASDAATPAAGAADPPPEPPAAPEPPEPLAAPTPPSDPATTPLHVGRVTKAAMIAFFIAFAILIGLSNTIGQNPLAGARVATKFGMFSAPPKSQPIVVRGVARRGRAVELLTNPNEADADWRERLRDQRERKWHDNVGRAAGLQQGYLAYRCRVHGADYRKVQLVALADIGMEEKVILERNCAPLPADAPRAAR